MEWDKLQAPSPRESMHSELLMRRDRHELQMEIRTAQPHFEFGAWLKLKNTDNIPVMLLLEYKDRESERWYIVDTARVHNSKGMLLLSGVVDLHVKKLQEICLYVCHPNPRLQVDVEELRFNGELIRKDYLDAFVA